MYPFKVSMWPNAKATSEAQRKDIEIKEFLDLYYLFTDNVKPIANKVDQPIITRKRQKSRSRDNTEWKPPFLITLDYDSVDIEPSTVHELLKKEEINHFIITTWTHKTLVTPQKENHGKNCFKVFTEVTAENEQELLIMTRGLAAIAGKDDITKVDDISSGIFLGGTHPDFRHQFNSFIYNEGSSVEDTAFYLKASCPPEKEINNSALDDFEMWDKTVGQKWTPERIKRALSVIKYEEVEGFSKMAIWYSLGYALHSTGDDDNFHLWDDWCLENCAEEGVYNHEENEKFWAKQTVPDNHKKLCTLATLWHLEKVFKNKQVKSEIKQSSWGFFDVLAKETPEPIEFLIQDLLVANSIGFLVGEGGVGKSSLCLEVAKAISSGRPLFDDERFITEAGTVAIINKEDSLNKIHNQVHNLVELDIDRILRTHNSAYKDFNEDTPEVELTKEEINIIKDRWRNVARPNWAQSNIRLTNQEGEDLEALGAILASLKSLKTELKETKRPDLKLVIFDPLNMFHGGDQNSQKDMSFMFSAFQQIQKELNTCVLIVHHKNKSQGFSGSHTIRDSGRFMWYLQHKMEGKEKSDKFIELYIEKNNDAKANYTALNFIRTDKGLLDKANIINEEVEQGEKK